jgi:intracellular sulfur oxidation DsrE/DsrF family protein
MRFLLAAALLGLALAGPALAQEKPQRLLIQISDYDPKVWGLALANARNVRHDLGPDKVEIEIVVYGPAIRMLEMDSDWRDRVTQVIDEGIRVVACENTMKSMKLTRNDMLGGVEFVKTGLAHIMKRELEGWAYARP